MFERTTGYLRASAVSITRSVNSATTIFNVSLLTAFDWNSTQYEELTLSQLQRLSRANYIARRDAFISYLENQYEGLDISSDGSIVNDPAGVYYV
jgi:hypothetical protein